MESAAPHTPAPSGTPVKPNEWPTNYQVSIAVDLKSSGGGGRKEKRPFVAAWVENSAGERVRTIAVWGNERKYLAEHRAWWKETKTNQEWAMSVTRATRSSGKHRLAWDGKDDHDQPLPSGSYTIFVESNREHGTYSIEHGVIECGRTSSAGTIPASAEFGESKLTYGPTER